ncbi:Uncharacterized protein dnl_47240 [Desulfonema limicola]|uniref:Uncharacterized protein n=1 Tax=Desulfonema limicola TaxID=45656 RepID=A0A975GI72_9BACT|nr:Uncharacterized protein dnl_47240 [Desulfonema limicola]
MFINLVRGINGYWNSFGYYRTWAFCLLKNAIDKLIAEENPLKAMVVKAGVIEKATRKREKLLFKL